VNPAKRTGVKPIKIILKIYRKLIDHLFI